MEQAKVEEAGGSLIWLRAIAQPWTGLKLKVTLGLMASKDIGKVPDSDHSRFPFINFLSLHIPILPASQEEANTCLPFIPYLLWDQEEECEDVPDWKTIVKACNGLFRETTAPHSKSNLNTLKEALKTEWKIKKVSKYIYPVLITEDTEPERENIEGGTLILSVW